MQRNLHSDYFNFYNILPGADYTFKVVPYNAAGVAGSAMTFKYKKAFPTVNSGHVDVIQSLVYDENGKTTGYSRPSGIEFYLYTSGSGNNVRWEVHRATKKNGPYTLLGTVDGSYNVWYYDSSIEFGKTYYYKARPVSGTDEYVKDNVEGSYSDIFEIKIEKPSASCNVYYDQDGAYLSLSNENFATGFEIYRATSKNGKYTLLDSTSDTWYVDKTIKSGSTYYYKVKGFYYDTQKKKVYKGDFSEPVGIKVLMGGIYLEIQQTATDKVKLTWGKVVGADSYEIYYRTGMSGDAYKLLTTTTKQSYTAKVSADTYYTFQIRAYKKEGGVNKYYQSATSGIQVGFRSPSNFRVTKRTASVKGTTATITATLKWDRVYGAKSYRIEAYDNTKNQKVILKKGIKSSTTSYTLKNTVTEGSVRYSDIRIYAVNGSKESSSYLNGSVSTLPSVTNVKVARKSATSAKVSWKAVAGADSYTVYRCVPTGYRVSIGETSKTTLDDVKLTPGVTYTYEVVARNTKCGISSSEYYYEDYVITNIADYVHKLGKTSIRSVKNTAAKTATITWKKAAYASQYVIYRSTSKNGTYKKVATVKADKTSYKDTKLTKGKTYYYKIEVKTVNDAGIKVTSDKSAAKSVKITK